MSARVDDYLSHLHFERRLADHTLESYARDLVDLARICRRSSARARSGSSRRISSIRARPDERGPVAAIGRTRWWPASAASIAISILHQHVTRQPAVDLEAPRAWKVLPKFLSVEDVDRLLARA